MKLFGTMRISENNHLEIGGCDAVTLAEKFGTPLYVMDELHIRNNCRLFISLFDHRAVETEVIYASKAFCNLAICRLMKEEGMSLDVVSGGELYIALKAGFPAERIYVHGNNKSYNEIRMAVEAGVKRIVVDNSAELYMLDRVCTELNRDVNVLLRVNPRVSVHTHKFIQTANNDSKFGLSIFDSDVYEAIEYVSKSSTMTYKGLHFHLGSQIFDTDPYYVAIRIIFDFIQKVESCTGVVTNELDLGGGFGVYYSNGDKPYSIEQILPGLLEQVQSEANSRHVKTPKVMIEPGRAIVANAGTTLYSVGPTKKMIGNTHYLFVDGGMTDNIRPALYGAKYEACLANRMTARADTNYTVVGKCCESGDVLIKDIQLASASSNDILAVASTGAYNCCMASNYNGLTKPAVVFVKEGRSRLVVRRESYEDLIRNDL